MKIQTMKSMKTCPWILISAFLIPLCMPLPAAAEFPGFHQGLDQDYPANGGYASTNTSGNGFMAMISPNQHVTRIVAINHKSDIAGTFRLAIYEGGDYNHYTGAVKIYDSGQLYHDGNGWQEFVVDPPVSIDRNTWYGIAWKTDGASYYSVPESEIPYSDCVFYYPIANEGTDSSVQFNDTLTISNPSQSSCNLHYVTDAPEPYITEVCNDPWAPSHPRHVNTPLNDGQRAVVHSGGTDSFMYLYKIWITENSDWDNPGIKVQQTNLNNNDHTFEVVFGALTPGTDAFLWVENEAGVVNSTAVPVHLEIPDSTPPEHYGDLQVIPEDAGQNLMGATYMFSQQFYDPETSVYRCSGRIKVNGGQTTEAIDAWVSGTGPYYTCTTVVDTAWNGWVLGMQMIATSGGGISENWIGGFIDDSYFQYRTVDGAGPEPGSSFTATAGIGQCSLSWSAASDSGAGLHPSEAYEIRWQEGSAPDIGGGSQLYIGTGTDAVHNGLNADSTYYYRLYYKDAFDNKSNHPGNAIACRTLGVAVEDGIEPTAKFINGTAVNQAISSFTLSTTVGSSDTVTGLTITGTNTDHVENVKIYRDSGTTAGEYDTSDQLIASGSYSGNEALFTGLNLAVSPESEAYIIAYDLAPQPTAGENLTAHVSAGTAQTLPVVVRDDDDAMIMVDTVPPSTTDNASSTWSASEMTVTLTPNDIGGSGVDEATGVFGCFGAGCVPAQLVGASMTTDCGDGNTCIYDVRYYSTDKAGNAEAVQTGLHQVLIDREPPAGATFSAYNDTSPIPLTWGGMTDAGSGLAASDTYRLSRADGPAPPTDCTSGTLLYLGTGASFTDSSVTTGQQYSYRLCAYDSLGNTASTFTATVVAGELCENYTDCSSCHYGPSDGIGGSSLMPSAGHVFHPFATVRCWECHRDWRKPYHVDGIVTFIPASGYTVSDAPWPPDGTTIGMSCGGPGMPVGGDSSGGPMGCHATGTYYHPELTPEWECFWWEEYPICEPPQGP